MEVILKVGVSVISCILFSAKALSQITLSGQIRPRFEFKNSSSTLRPLNADPSFFITQRSRLGFHYRQSRAIFHMSIQDVRTWGQDASTINNDGSRLGVHEAWAEVILTNKKDGSFKKPTVEYLSVKAGRQEIEYDDGILFGNHDWLQQGRRHDALVFKLLDKGWQTDLGLAVNRNDALNFNGNFYTPANVPPYLKDSRGILVPSPSNYLPLILSNGNSARNGSPFVQNTASTNRLFQLYKSMEYLYVSKTHEENRYSFLLIADQFGENKLDSVQSSDINNQVGYVYGLRFNSWGTNARFTAGPSFKIKAGKTKNTTVLGSVYLQLGKGLDGKTLSSHMVHLVLDHKIKNHEIGAGFDLLSGNDGSGKNKKFDPLYGSPHEFWGYMDFFYATTGSPSGGLVNPHLKWQYTSSNKRFTIATKYHYFGLAEDMYDVNGKAIDRYLGSEIDLSWIYSLSKITSIEGGTSFMFATHSMEYAKSVTPNSSLLNGQWIFIQLNVKPEFIIK